MHDFHFVIIAVAIPVVFIPWVANPGDSLTSITFRAMGSVKTLWLFCLSCFFFPRICSCVCLCLSQAGPRLLCTCNSLAMCRNRQWRTARRKIQIYELARASGHGLSNFCSRNKPNRKFCVGKICSCRPGVPDSANHWPAMASPMPEVPEFINNAMLPVPLLLSADAATAPFVLLLVRLLWTLSD